jgi:hypothetical protein
VKKTKKKSACIIAVVVCGVIMAGVVLCLLYTAFYPKLYLKKRLEQLLNQKYTYSITYDAEGIETDFLGNEVHGTVTGKKGDDVFYGRITNQGMSYFDLYVDKNWNMIFNIKPLLESILNEIQDSTKLPLSLVSSSIGDIFISSEQIKSIAGESSFVMPDIENINFSDVAYTVALRSDVSESDMLLGRDAYYFDITIKEYEMNLLLGIPKEKDIKKISLQINQNDVTWKFSGEYQQTDDVEIEMPEETLSEETIDAARKIYGYWKKIKE